MERLGIRTRVAVPARVARRIEPQETSKLPRRITGGPSICWKSNTRHWRNGSRFPSSTGSGVPLMTSLRCKSSTASGRNLGLEFAERGRARTLLDSVDNAGPGSRVTVATSRERLPRGTALLYYASTDRALVSWVITRDSVGFATHPLSKVALVDLTSSYRRTLQQGDSLPRIKTLSAQLYDTLVRPQHERLVHVGTIIVVPDGPLHDVPFAGLLNQQTGRFLVEDFEIGFAASAATFARASEQFGRRQTSGQNRMLVVGNPLLRDKNNRTVPTLPEAEAEAAAVSRFFKQSQLLVGAQATKRRFLEAATEADLIHFAGHAISNPAHPLLSRLLLAAESPSESGVLFGHELQRARFPRVRLVWYWPGVQPPVAACNVGKVS